MHSQFTFDALAVSTRTVVVSVVCLAKLHGGGTVQRARLHVQGRAVTVRNESDLAHP